MPQPEPIRMVLRAARVAIVAFGLACAGDAESATFTVTSASDPGAGSLSAAIQAANANPGPDTIEFAIAGSGLHTIKPQNPSGSESFTTITDVVTIDGYSQSGSSPNTNGPGLGSNAVIQIELKFDDTLGLPGQPGLIFESGSNGSLVKGLRITNFRQGIILQGSNTTVAGNEVLCDASGSAFAGVRINGDDNMIGGETPAARNVIAIVGTSGIEAGSTGNIIAGNFIGTNAAGTAAPGFGPQVYGVRLLGPGNTIGGVVPAARNVISGSGAGIRSEEGHSLIRGNYIGTDVTGTLAIPNAAGGVFIGGSDDIVNENLISGNLGPGIASLVGEGEGGAGPSNASIYANRIGTDAAGTAPLPNTIGILLQGSANVVGGTTASLPNLIAFNLSDGVRIDGSASAATGNTIRGNSIHSNGGKAIANVSGGNTQLAPPAVTGASPISGTTCANCVVDVYSDNGDEGRIYEGSTTANGLGDFTYNPAVTGPFVHATATDGSGNTSEMFVPTADLSLTLGADILHPELSESVLLMVTVTNGGPTATTGVAASIPIPAGLSHVSNDGGGSYVPGTGVWTVGSLTSGASAVLKITTQFTGPTSATVVAQVSASDVSDPDSTPNNGNALEDDQKSVQLVLVGAEIIVNDAGTVVNAIDGKCTLIEAIKAANTDAPSGAVAGECVGGGGADTIRLQAATYTLTAVDNTLSGFGNGLPQITSPITIEGGDALIERSLAAPSFRLLAVTAAGNLTLKDVTVRFGNLANAASACGGGIFNAGTLSLLRATVTVNSIGDFPLVTEVAGGGICNLGTLDLVDSTITANFVNSYLGALGGGIYSSGTTTMTNSTVADNGVRVDPLGGSLPVATGGGILVRSGSLTAVDSEIADNRATANGVGFSEGGGLGAINGATVSLTRMAVSGNESKLVGVGFDPAKSIGGGMVVFSAATVTIVDSTIGGATDADANVSAGTGGGIAVGPTAQLTMTGGTIAKNRASGAANIAGGGGGLANGTGVEPGGGSVTLTNVSVNGNQSTGGDGGGIFNRGALTMNGGELRANVALASGGGLANGVALTFTGGNATLTGVTIADNTAAFFGGGAANSTVPGAATFAILTLSGSTVESNQSTGAGAFGNGGGLSNDSNSTMGVLGGTVVRNNTAALNGGGIVNGGFLTVDASTVSDNTAVNGAGISQAGGFAGIRNGAIVSGNDATAVGGGVAVNGGVVDVADATIRENTAPLTPSGAGGGIAALGAVVHVARSTIADNVAYGGAGVLVGTNGAASSAVDVDRSTLNGNQGVLSSALGIVGGNANATRLTNSTVSGNLVTTAAGFSVNAGSTLYVNGSTIVANLGGGIINGQLVALFNSIVAGNLQQGGTPVDCATVGASTWQTIWNLTGRATGCPIGFGARFVEPGELFTAVLGPLADNGGTTKTHALLPGSPAVDGGVTLGGGGAGLDACLTVDQLGNARPTDGNGDGAARCDVGAVEPQTPLPSAPVLASLAPSSGPAGGAQFTVTVTGSGFQPTSEVRWNGAARATTFGSATSLTATIPASDLVSAVDLVTARVQVVTTGGGSSAALPFTIASAKVDGLETTIVGGQSSGSVSTPPPAADRAGVGVTVTNNGFDLAPITVTTATYDTNPTTGTIFNAAGFVDIQVKGADLSDSLLARFYYPQTVTGTAEKDLQLIYWSGFAWNPVYGPFGTAPVKNTTDDLDGTTSGGRFAVTLNATSQPKITALADTVFAMAPLGTCRGLVPTIIGGPGNDKLTGTPGDDVILDLSGNNTVKGKGGNDTICLGDGDDKVTTSDGNDWIDAGPGKNKVKSGAGNDTVSSGDGDDAIDTGKGDDAVVAGNGKNKIKTGSENDAIIAGSGDDKIDAGAGDDTVEAGEGKNTVKTGAGADQITTGGGDDKIDAGKDSDTVDAGDGNNSVKTGPGADQITTGAGNDKIDAGKDTDTCVAGLGTNTLKHCEQ